ncbi:PQQ-dependent sugar dehydrogenase [Ferrimonas marina]|uniref:Glucose/arabinose dehydrogenase, beta-propeller fold n=1 Tax=Ferrimonas marina TaxID=299255 RepID=A0A1M5NNA4_9GAMM|nr:PQQ-dependent sugar dehydrogenase [Ferrimonas marina]SHG91064.1 Glucose/arabinose dehydrogenase, beta-propeller fold [Ferrimonas marina]
MFKPFNKLHLSVSVLLLSLSSVSHADALYQETSEQGEVAVELVAEGFGVVWGMAFLSDDEIVFTERDGKMGVVSISSGKVQRIEGVPQVKAEGQGGLLDVATAPGFKAGDWIYLTYSKDIDGEGVTVLARAKLAKGKVESWEELVVTQSRSDTGRHYGSRIEFDGQGHVFFTIGDRGVRPSSQDLQQHNGSVLRVKLDGSVPSDNPFVDNKDVLPEIWSYGHRNPQGIARDATNDRLWVNEHGPRGGDEINLVEPKRNYGWPVISYGKEYWGPKSVGEGTHKEGMEQPKKVYTPSIAPSSLMLYTGEVFPAWSGNLFSGALKLTHINRVAVDDKGEIQGEERLLEDFEERIRSLRQGPDGFIYFSTDSGKILRLVPAK